MEEEFKYGVNEKFCVISYTWNVRVGFAVSKITDAGFNVSVNNSSIVIYNKGFQHCSPCRELELSLHDRGN